MSISPPTTTDDGGGGPITTRNDANVIYPLNYWCHECDMSVLVIAPLAPAYSSTFTPLCPNCRRDFLEQMDSFPPAPDSATSGPRTYQFGNPFPIPIPASLSPSNDIFLLDNPYFQHVVNHFAVNNNAPNPPQCNTPASKSAIESLPHVTVDSAILEKDPTIVCPVCKDQFSINAQAKLLPCKHTYHADCILPWLEINNSCPVCRYRLPIECDDDHEVQGGETFIGAARLDELLDDEQDLFGFRSILRNVVRRQQQNGGDNEEHDGNIENWNRRVEWDNEVLFSPTQIGEAGSGGGSRRGDHVERANSVETVTSFPRWPMEGGASGSGIGDGAIGAGACGGRGIDEEDPVKF